VDPSDERLGVVLAAAGSSHAPANAAVAAVTTRWASRVSWAGVTAAFAAAADPCIGDAVRSLRSGGASRVAVGSWFLAPGLLPDRIVNGALEADPDALIAEPLGAAPEVVDVVLDRYAEAAESDGPRLRYA
jgi:sirohydrochlorin ferrochelatase